MENAQSVPNLPICTDYPEYRDTYARGLLAVRLEPLRAAVAGWNVFDGFNLDGCHSLSLFANRQLGAVIPVDRRGPFELHV